MLIWPKFRPTLSMKCCFRAMEGHHEGCHLHQACQYTQDSHHWLRIEVVFLLRLSLHLLELLVRYELLKLIQTCQTNRLGDQVNPTTHSTSALPYLSLAHFIAVCERSNATTSQPILSRKTASPQTGHSLQPKPDRGFATLPNQPQMGLRAV